MTCLQQLGKLQQHAADFARTNTRVVALTTDAPEKNRHVATSLGLTMPILSDADGHVIKALDMWDARYGIASEGFLLFDARRRVVSSWRGYWSPSEQSIDSFLEKIAGISKD